MHHEFTFIWNKRRVLTWSTRMTCTVVFLKDRNCIHKLCNFKHSECLINKIHTALMCVVTAVSDQPRCLAIAVKKKLPLAYAFPIIKNITDKVGVVITILPNKEIHQLQLVKLRIYWRIHGDMMTHSHVHKSVTSPSDAIATSVTPSNPL